MPYQPPAEPRTRRARIAGWVTFLFAALLVVLVTYLGYVGFEGSRQLTEAPNPTDDCRTPASLGWEYEAINYDIAADADAAEGDCGALATAGGEVTGPDGIGLAGWYVPAASGIGPQGPTVVLVHGWGSNKSNMLDRASLLHDEYNLLFVDLRNHGQSGDAPTTQGVDEAGDVTAMLDWLEVEKGPSQVALFGVSMGGATALAQAHADERVDAIVVESTHATILSTIQARLRLAGYPLEVPGSWAILLGTLLRTGEDASGVDAAQSAARLDGRPLLLIYGGADETFAATDGEDILAAAEASGSSAVLVVCDEAGHAGSFDACPETYRDAVLGFLGRELATGG